MTLLRSIVSPALVRSNLLAVAHEFHVPASGCIAPFPCATYIHSALPIARFGVQLLVRQHRTNLDIETHSRHAHAPSRRIPSTSRARPMVTDVDHHLIG